MGTAWRAPGNVARESITRGSERGQTGGGRRMPDGEEESRRRVKVAGGKADWRAGGWLPWTLAVSRTVRAATDTGTAPRRHPRVVRATLSPRARDRLRQVTLYLGSAELLFLLLPWDGVQ